MPGSRRALPALAALAFAAAVACPGTAGADSAGDEARLAAIVNHARSTAGLPPIAVDAPTSLHARGWSNHMAFYDALFHDPKRPAIAASGGWWRTGENVAMGYDLNQIARAWWASPAHRANLLGRWDRMAVGVMPISGRYWATIYFLRR